MVYDDEGGNFTGFVLNGKARMPYESEVDDFNNSNGYLYEYLDGFEWSYEESTKPTNNISGIYGYWTLSTYEGSSSGAWYVNYDGSKGNGYVYNADYGVRPVISIKIQ